MNTNKTVDKNIYCGQTNQFSLTKTVGFGLNPVFGTKNAIKKYSVIEDGKEKAEQYEQAKEIMDKAHKFFIDSILNQYNKDWLPLFNAYVKQNEKKASTAVIKAFKKMLDEYKKEIAKAFKSSEYYEQLTPANLIKMVENDTFSLVNYTKDEKKTLLFFKNFATFFSKYQSNRKDIYENTKNGTISVPNRLLDDNFPIYVSNILLFEQLSDDLKEECILALKPFEQRFDVKAEDFFNVERGNGFSSFLTQKGIEIYNTLIGGYNEKDNVKIRGLNEICNEAYTQKRLEDPVKFIRLKKQVLSDKEPTSVLPEKFEDSFEVMRYIDEYGEKLLKTFDALYDEVFEAGKTANLNRIFVNKKALHSLSYILYKNADELNEVLAEAKIKSSQKHYSVETLNDTTCYNILEEVMFALKKNFEDVVRLKKNVDAINRTEKVSDYTDVKAYLDQIQICEKTLKIIAAVDHPSRDVVFYDTFDRLYKVFRENIDLYNKTRNFVTKKPFSTDKFKLTFSHYNTLGGWDKGAIHKNLGILFLKDDEYYLGIVNKQFPINIDGQEQPFANAYKKVDIDYCSDANKTLPRCFIMSKQFKAPADIVAGYTAGKHKSLSELFDLDFCHKLINYYKECLKEHPTLKRFQYKFSPTEDYSCMEDFYKEVDLQSYKMHFSYVDENVLKKATESGQLFLFRIYNKDLNGKSKGNPDLTTLYWKALFTEENRENCVFKLSGGAEVFFRDKSLENICIHKKGSTLINKVDKNGEPIPPKEYNLVRLESHHTDIETLRKKYPNYTFKVCPYDIMKDRRYGKPSYHFHVPIEINYCKEKSSKASLKSFNRCILEKLQDNKEFNLMGIDRAEHNLLSVVVINQKGEILLQENLNIINNFNYQHKLTQVEENRQEQRKSWNTIEKIKDVKKGYLSGAVKHIIDLMFEYNAVLVMANLDQEFKHSRSFIDKQIYQHFEKAILRKLAFLCFKNKADDEEGSIRKGYQLTLEQDDLTKIYNLKQNGFVFYVSPAYTERIDPTTGFVNMFPKKSLQYKNRKLAREFIEKFKSISYDKKLGFKFVFRYCDFDTKRKDFKEKWTIYTGDFIRHIWKRTQNGEYVRQEIDITKEMKELFQLHDIDLTKEDLRQQILDNETPEMYQSFLYLFRKTVDFKYVGEDTYYIASPVLNDEGTFFNNLNTVPDKYPQDSDKNAAYHIALHGLRYLNRVENGEIKKDEPNKQQFNWLRFVREKEYLK